MKQNASPDNFNSPSRCKYRLLTITFLFFTKACDRFVTTVLGAGFNSEKELDLANIVDNEVNANTPILMCSVAGFDASGKGPSINNIQFYLPTHTQCSYREGHAYMVKNPMAFLLGSATKFWGFLDGQY